MQVDMLESKCVAKPFQLQQLQVPVPNPVPGSLDQNNEYATQACMRCPRRDGEKNEKTEENAKK